MFFNRPLSFRDKYMDEMSGYPNIFFKIIWEKYQMKEVDEMTGYELKIPKAGRWVH